MDDLTRRGRGLPPEESMEFFEDTHAPTDLFGTPGSNVVYVPHTPEDVETIINYLRFQQNVIVQLTNEEPWRAQRILDMLSGAVYALGGGIVEVDRERNIFLLAPADKTITTKV